MTNGNTVIQSSGQLFYLPSSVIQSCLLYSPSLETLVSNYNREPGEPELKVLYITFPLLIIIIPGTTWNIPENETGMCQTSHSTRRNGDLRPGAQEGNMRLHKQCAFVWVHCVGSRSVVLQLSKETASFRYIWRHLISYFYRTRLPGEPYVPSISKNSCVVMSLLYRAPCWTHSDCSMQWGLTGIYVEKGRQQQQTCWHVDMQTNTGSLFACTHTEHI